MEDIKEENKKAVKKAKKRKHQDDKESMDDATTKKRHLCDTDSSNVAVIQGEKKTLKKKKKRKREDDEEEEEDVKNTEPHESETESSSNADVVQAPILPIADKSFSSLEGIVSKETLRAIEKMGFTQMTDIQAQSIPHLLSGKDVMGTAQTGQGKTLAFLIPVVEQLKKLNFNQGQGTGAIIITPVRELGEQIFGVLKELLEFHPLTCAHFHGGTDRKAETRKLADGVNIVVATPGRLLDHLQNTKSFNCDNLRCLVIDEADRLMQDNFEDDMRKIVALLPQKRQVAMFSATLTPQTEGLAKMSMKKPVYISVDDQKPSATVEGLQQGYFVCEADKRFLVLYTFLRRHEDKHKIMVFFSARNVVKFYYSLLNFVSVKVDYLHGKQKQSKRSATFNKFCEAKLGILLCTNVAARGLDIKNVDWIFQYDPPDTPEEYIHRVGRTARGEGGVGCSVLLLQPQEVAFIDYLRDAKVPMMEYEMSWMKVANVQSELEKLVNGNRYLVTDAKEAFKSYVRAYASHSTKEAFNVQRLDVQRVAKCFALKESPIFDLSVFSNRNHTQTRKKSGYGYHKPGDDKKKFYKQVKSKKPQH